MYLIQGSGLTPPPLPPHAYTPATSSVGWGGWVGGCSPLPVGGGGGCWVGARGIHGQKVQEKHASMHACAYVCMHEC